MTFFNVSVDMGSLLSSPLNHNGLSFSSKDGAIIRTRLLGFKSL